MSQTIHQKQIHMAKIAYPSTYLKERRVRLGLEPCDIAKLTGLNQEAYRQIECRGQLPEEHFSKLAAALQVTVEDLKAEKAATMMSAMLGIDKLAILEFIGKVRKK